MINTNKDQKILSPVVKSLLIPLTQKATFDLFTDGFNSWWPTLTHSVGAENTVSCHMDLIVGGRVFETLADGKEHEWGKILAWESPSRFVMSWNPGRDGNTAQEVEVSFNLEGNGTRLILTHRNWETLGDKAAITREGYDSGWDIVLGKYTEITNS